MQNTRRKESGTAILITMIIIVGLLGGGAALLNVQMASSRSAATMKSKMTALYCAEAGLAAARSIVASSYSQWTGSLCNPSSPQGTGNCDPTSTAAEPSWLQAPTLSHDIDGDGVADFTVAIVDNNDEVSPAANNMTLDNDLQVYVVSTCIKSNEMHLTVSELVQYTPGGTCYSTQAGGCGGGGNNF